MQKSNVWLATALLNDRVRNSAGENLGKIEDIAIKPAVGHIQYAIFSFDGVLGTDNRLFAIPWTSLSISPSRDSIILNIDRKRLERAPCFDRNNWPDMADPVWRRSIHDYYGLDRRVGRRQAVYVEPQARPAKSGMSLLSGVALTCLIVAVAWMTFLTSTRGWDQTKHDIQSSVRGAAYAAKESSHDAALTTKVKTALALSKRIPAGQVDVDSDGDVVTLRGEVPSDQIRDLAESIARDVPGVHQVYNHIFAVSRTP